MLLDEAEKGETISPPGVQRRSARSGVKWGVYPECAQV
jgi:hypothetical protein